MKPYTIYNLIADLKKLIEDHPEVDFKTMDISMNCEYTCTEVQLCTTGHGTFVNLN